MISLPRLSLLAFVLLALLPSLAAAESLLIRNADIETLTSAGRLERTDLLIVDGRIEKIGRNLRDSRADVFDASGMRLTPGVFNAYTQIGVVEISGIEQTLDFSVDSDHFTASLNVVDAFNPLSTSIPQNRIHGLTRALVAPQASESLFAGLASVVNLSGSLHKSIEKEAVGVVVNYSEYSHKIAGGSRAAALATIRYALTDAQEFSRNRDKYLNGDGRDLSLSLNDLQALVPVVEGRRYLIVQVQRSTDILSILEMGRSIGIRLILVGVQEGWMVAEQIAAARVPVIIDPIYNLPSEFETLGSRLENAAILNRAGVTLLFTGMGWHSTHNAYLVTQSAGNSVANGLPYEAALKAIFSNPARVFGLDDTGTIEVGQVADLVVWNGDPLEVLREAQLVMVDGVRVPMISRATRLRDRYYQRLK